jgi:hypothetical protein
MSDEGIQFLGSDRLPKTVGVSQPLPVTAGNAAATATTASVSSSASSVTILAANTSRKGVTVANQSTATLYLSYTSPATTTNAFIAMAANSFLALEPPHLGTGVIYGIWSAANGTAQVSEFV